MKLRALYQIPLQQPTAVTELTTKQVNVGGISDQGLDLGGGSTLQWRLVGTLLFLGLVVLALGAFLVVTVPLMLLANKAIAAPWEREAEQMKSALSRAPLRFSEDAVPLRELGAAPFAVGVRWMRADVWVDGHALYVMRYNVVFGFLRIGQPNLRLTWVGEPGVGGFKGVPILGRPTADGDAVEVRTEMGLTALKLRLRPRDPRALLAAIEAMR